MTHTLCTIGYEKRSLTEYIDILKAAHVDVVIDVRETAWSRKPGFSKGSLSAGLAAAGIEYHHAKFAGSPKSLRADATDHADAIERFRVHLENSPSIRIDLDALIATYQSAGKRVAITCFERHPGDCHRGVLAEAWVTQRDRVVEHLAPDGCERMIKQT